MIKQRTFFDILFFIIIATPAFNQNWSTVGDFSKTGVSDIRVLYNDTVDNKLYIGGQFNSVNSITAYSIATYDGVAFDSLSNANMGLGQIVVEITRFKNKIYIGGFLYSPEDFTSNCGLLYLESNSWGVCGGGLGGNIQLLYSIDSTLIIGGLLHYNFNGDTLGTMITWNNITYNCCWDNTFNDFWESNSTNCAIIVNDTLYLGGNFDLSNGLSNIAYWNGIKWTSLDNGILGNSWVNSIVEYEGELYIGGYFTKSSGNAGNFIQRWNGTQWNDVGDGVCCGQIFDMAVYNDELYVVGQFNSAGNVAANNIAKWDGVKWCGFGDVFDNSILSIETFNNELYIGGGFKKINNDSISLFAKWIGEDYVDTCSQLGSVSDVSIEKNYRVFPNPVQNNITIDINEQELLAEKNKIVYKVIDPFGREIITGEIKESPFTLSFENFPKGVYLIVIRGDMFVNQHTVVKE